MISLTLKSGRYLQKKKEVIEKSLRRYYAQYLNSDFFAVFVEEEHKPAAVAFLSIAEKPAGISFPTGKTATVFNVLTYPQYRRKGYATKAMKMLIEEAKKKDVSYIELLATKDGRPLYQKLGFEEFQPSGFLEMKLMLV